MKSRRHLTGLRIVALVFLALLATDIVDVDCDAPQVPSASLAITALGDNPSPDACALGCVPDCFCCSSASAAWSFCLAVEATLVRLPAEPDPAPAIGVKGVPYHPPHKG